MSYEMQDMEDDLLLRYLKGEASGEEAERVVQWLSIDLHNRKELDRLELIWTESGRLVPAPVAVDVDAAWSEMSGRIDRYEASLPASGAGSPFIRGYLRTAMAVAAAVLVLAALSGLFRWVWMKSSPAEIMATERVVYDSLPDGSAVTLNKGSKLSLDRDFGLAGRKVTLVGEAVFQVASTGTPFRVGAGSASVWVLGTVFLVRSDSVSAEVAVSHGRVLFFAGGPETGISHSVILEAGQSARWEKGMTKPILTGEPGPDLFFWADHSLDFRNRPLSEVLPLLEKLYGASIRYDDPAILSCRLTAGFGGEPLESILKVIAESFGLGVEAIPGGYRIKGNGCDAQD